MIERLDEFLREGVAQRLVDLIRLSPRGASTIALQVGIMLLVTNVCADVVWMASLGILGTMNTAVALGVTGMIVYLVRTHTRSIDTGRGMTRGYLLQRIILLFIGLFNIQVPLAMLLINTLSPLAQLAETAKITAWVMIVLGVYIRLCRKPPPPRDRKFATV